MTSRQHQDWINHGRPDSGLALPLARLRDLLRAAGYQVFDYPNDAHLDAQPPEDHTYYSETGWPNASPKWWRHAIDIMPTKGGADLLALGQRIVVDRNAGLATWIKYVNVPTSAGLAGAVQHRWEPNHATGSSGDTGHIHISSVTGCETLNSSYNPLSIGAPSVELTTTYNPRTSKTSTVGGTLGDLQNLRDALYTAAGDLASQGLAVPTGTVLDNFITLTGKVEALQAQAAANSTVLAAQSAKLDSVLSKLAALAGGIATVGDVAVSGSLHFEAPTT